MCDRSNSYTLVLHKHGDLLYDGVTACVTQKLVSISKVVHSATVERLLEVIVREWEQHKLIMTMIRDILMYMVSDGTTQRREALTGRR
jgi:cullin 3